MRATHTDCHLACLPRPNTFMKYPAFSPFLNEDTIARLSSCILAKSISGNYGFDLEKLELTYSELHNHYSAVTCSSGTSALHLACLSLGMKPEHTVVVPATTNMATFFAPMYIGAKVISCDVDATTGLIDLRELQHICQSETVDFVLPVHLYGHVVSAISLRSLSTIYGFKVIEDCAEAHFARNDDGCLVGSSFDAGCFSFYANKIISAGEGGLVLFKDSEAAARARNLKNLSFGDDNCPSKFFHREIGYNYRMTNLSAALVNQCLDSRDYILQYRDKISTWYTERLRDRCYIQILYSQLRSYRVNWVYCIKLNPQYVLRIGGKQSLLKALAEGGVEARDFFYPADHQPFYQNYLSHKGYSALSTTSSLDFYAGSIYLPVYLDLSEDNVDDICAIIDHTILSI